MRTARLLTLLAALAAVAFLAGSARSAESAPTGLHGFLLRADEPVKTSFSRTPSFAWNPVPGAIHYEFQLSLSNTFRDNSVVYADQNALTPVEAPPITLPWITGNPHALYARVRAITPDGTTPWSDNFGFDMVPPAAPTPLAAYPGLLRWTPVEGAHGYEVWLIDAKKLEISTTNSLDEREFYTFHQTAAWTGTVRWRIRALRIDTGPAINGLPAVTYGAWSPIYTSTNPSVTSGPIKLVGTISDVFSNGAANSPAHELTPAYLWTGNQTIDGKSVELYRVYVFTDKQCLNRVYTSAVIGSQAYAPRPLGPLSLPSSKDGMSQARGAYLPDGPEPPGYTYDDAIDSIATTESTADASPTTAPPASPAAASPTDGSSSSSSSSSSSTSSPSGGGTAGSSIAAFLSGARTGAPIDLWDTNWPSSGYYWTVVGVQATSPATITTSVVAPGAAKGATLLPVANGAGFNPGDQITIGTEQSTVTAVTATTLTLAVGLASGHAAGDPVVRTGGSLYYQDLELPQDVCAAGRVMRFGKASEPSLLSSGDLFASGLSSDGRLTSGLHQSQFYGQPLVSWTPALGAEAYQVQWSNTQAGLLASSGANTLMTKSTSIVLPVGPGTWWYRVRGFDYSLPTGAQQMSWSDAVKLVVAQPKFKVIGGTAATSTSSGLATRTGDGFSLSVPASWTRSSGGFAYADPVTHAGVTVLRTAGRGTRSFAQWKQALVAQAESVLGATPAVSVTTLRAGKAVKLTFTRTVSGSRVAQVQYVVDAGPNAYMATFTTAAARFAADGRTFAKIIASFRVG